MSFDVYLAFGGVALLGIVGFLVAWFSAPSAEKADNKALKQKMIEEAEQAKSLLLRLSQQINTL